MASDVLETVAAIHCTPYRYKPPWPAPTCRLPGTGLCITSMPHKHAGQCWPLMSPLANKLLAPRTSRHDVSHTHSWHSPHITVCGALHGAGCRITYCIRRSSQSHASVAILCLAAPHDSWSAPAVDGSTLGCRTGQHPEPSCRRPLCPSNHNRYAVSKTPTTTLTAS